MTKAELVRQLHVEQKHNHLDYGDARFGLDVILESLTNAMASGKRIEVRGFGSFTLHYREARLGRNPKTGNPVYVPDKHIPNFRPSQELRQCVNNLS